MNPGGGLAWLAAVGFAPLAWQPGGADLAGLAGGEGVGVGADELETGGEMRGRVGGGRLLALHVEGEIRNVPDVRVSWPEF